MPVSIHQLLRDEPGPDGQSRAITLVPGSMALRDALEQARQAGVFAALVVQRTGSGYDLIDAAPLRRMWSDPRDRAPQVQAWRAALADERVAAQPVERCPLGRVEAEVAFQGSLSTRAAYDLAATCPLQMLVITAGGFVGVMAATSPLRTIRDIYRSGFLALGYDTPLGAAIESARQARLGDDNPVFVHLADGTWGAATIFDLVQEIQTSGADALAWRASHYSVLAFEQDDIGQRQADELAEAAPPHQIVVLSEGRVIGYTGKQARGASNTLECPSCHAVGTVHADLATLRCACRSCGATFSATWSRGQRAKPPDHAGPPGEPAEPPAPRYVDPAFVAAGAPAQALERSLTLRAGERYYFRLGIGALEAKSISAEAVAFPAEVLAIPPEGLLLRVAIFNDGFEALEQQAGELRLFPAGPAQVSENSRSARPDGVDADALARYLYFGLRAPQAPGEARLRACIYYRGNLLQSWAVRARVTAGGEPLGGGQAGASAGAHIEYVDEQAGEFTLRRAKLVGGEGQGLLAYCDFTLTTSFGAMLQALGERPLSILVNENADGTHGLRVAGAGDLQCSFDVKDAEAAKMLDVFRGRLRQAMYTTPADPADPPRYRYGTSNKGDEATLVEALELMAEAGYQLFDYLFTRSVTDASFNAAQDIQDRVRAPATLQFMVREGGTWSVPWAGVYDHPLSGTRDTWSVCDAFLAAVRGGADLAGTECFQGRCPHGAEDNVVCASGFWGYRHVIEMLPSVKGRDLDLVIPRAAGPAIDMGVSTDPRLARRIGHTQALERLAPLRCGEDKAKIKDLLTSSQAQLVYFFCHGDRSELTPLLRVGDPFDKQFIQPSDMRTWRIRWQNSHPLVFINGCHTVDLQPGDLLDFALSFVQVAQASGVIGSEITIVEQLAVEYGEGFVAAFLQGGAVGQVTRDMRLKLLAKYNPLGLVYTPYCHADLKLL